MRLRALLLSIFCLAAILVAGCGGSSPKSSRAPVQTTQHNYGTASAPRAHARGFGLPPKGFTLRRLSPTSTPTLEQFDSVTVSTVPSYARAVAGYTSGFWPTYGPLVAAFPRAYHISIAVNIAHQAQCLDDEPGDASPSQAGWWVHWELSNGWKKPCVYASLSDMAAVRANITAWGISRARYFLWDANWTYSPHLDAGFDATQWTDRSLGRNLDESTATLPFLGASAPKPGPSPGQLAAWTRARDASLRAYHHSGCTQPVLGPRNCGQFAWRVVHYQALLDQVQHRPACFGKHAQRHASLCQILRPEVAIWSRAVTSTVKAEGGQGCESGQKAVRNRVCDILRARQAYFQRRINRALVL